MDNDKPCKATGAKTLEQHIRDVNIPKNEAEWWANRELAAKDEEIKRLSEALEKMIDEIHSYDPARKIIIDDYFKEVK